MVEGRRAASTLTPVYPIEYNHLAGLKRELKELPIPFGSSLDRKAIVELGLPDDLLVILVARDDDFMVPSGGTVLEDGDTLLVLSDKKSFEKVVTKFNFFNSQVAG